MNKIENSKGSLRVKTTTNRAEYKRLTTIDQDPYREECWGTRNRRNSMIEDNYMKPDVYGYQWRANRSWKHNRKTQWKQKKKYY